MIKRGGRHFRSNSGVAYVLAMLYVLLLSVLAVGFCAASLMSTQLAHNDRCAAEAQAAAESGLEFVRLELSHLQIPHAQADDELLQTIADKLGREMNESANMNGHAVIAAGGVIFLPADNDYVALDHTGGDRFQAQIATAGSGVWVKIIGRGQSPTIQRAIQLKFEQKPIADESSTAIHFVPVPTTYEEVPP